MNVLVIGIKLDDKTKERGISLLYKARAAHMMCCVMALFSTSGNGQKRKKNKKSLEEVQKD